MSNYATLKAAIQQVVKTNGNNEITGALLQQSLLSMINSLGAGYQFVGIATPTTNPGTPDQKIFYIANGKGTYTNFGGINVTEDEVIFLVRDNAWHKAATGIAADAKLKEAVTGLAEIAGKINTKQDKLTAGSGIIINGSVISATSSGGISVTVDAALSATSTNPVQNKVVKEALDKKQAKLTAGNGITINGSEISTAYKIWHGSQAEYDAIAAKDDMTIYLIEES